MIFKNSLIKNVLLIQKIVCNDKKILDFFICTIIYVKLSCSETDLEVPPPPSVKNEKS